MNIHFSDATQPGVELLWDGEGGFSGLSPESPRPAPDATPAFEESAHGSAKDHHVVVVPIPTVVVEAMPTTNFDHIKDINSLFKAIQNDDPQKQPPNQLLATEQPTDPTLETPPPHQSVGNACPRQQLPQQMEINNEQPPVQFQPEGTIEEPTTEQVPILPSQMLLSPPSSKRSVHYNDESQQVRNSISDLFVEP